MKQEDTRPYLTELLFDGRKRYVDPTGRTVKFNMAKQVTNIIDHGTAYVVPVTVDATTAAALAGDGYLAADGSPFAAGSYKAAEYRWEGANDTATTGEMSYEWETTDGTGGILTFPNGGNNTLTIQPQVK